MLRRLGFALLAVTFLAWHAAAEAQTPANPDEIVLVTGHERLVWDQAAKSAEELSGFVFVIFVDDVPSIAESVECNEFTIEPVRCSAAIPQLREGAHVIELAVMAPRTGAESSKSSPLRVFSKRMKEEEPELDEIMWTSIASDGFRLRARVIAKGIQDATDVTSLPDGRIVIAERAGRLWTFNPADSSLKLAATLPDVNLTHGSGLLAIAASTDVDQRSTLHVVYISENDVRLARFLVTDAGLTAHATLLEGLPASPSQPRAVIRTGPDHKLYLALDDGGRPDRAADLGAVNSKVLRLDVDGTSADDAPRPYARGTNHPLGMTWSADGSIFWLASSEGDGVEYLRADAHGPSASGAGVRFALPAELRVTSMLRYSGKAIEALNNDLLLAGSRSILRLKVKPDGTVASSEWLFEGRLENVRAMTVDAQGNLYLIRQDHLVRITAQP
jgi:hypothetical protein